MKANLSKQIARVRSMLERANDGIELSRLIGLLMMLQSERILELEKQAAPTNRRKIT